MARPERQQAVFNLLRDLRGLDQLKSLFWSELNYERVNQPLSRRGWNKPAANALDEDPVLFAAGGQDGDFHVIYGRLATDQLLRGPERLVVSRLLCHHPYSLFVFSNRGKDRWHFLNIKYDEDAARRQLFRRITVGPEERLRTASERLGMLNVEDVPSPSPLAIQERHDDAFDVEKVQAEFFRTLNDIYKQSIVPDVVRGLKDEAKARHAGLILLNRLLFLYFIQKKGWLDGRYDYLAAAFQDHRTKSKSASYYGEFLWPLFQALSIPTKDRDSSLAQFKAIPFLNGGLFEPQSTISDADLKVTNATFARMFDELLERFNFTVAEDTPLDIEVAVDPEMLGKVFEELVTGRHDTGAYYTPRPVVSFMCREALKGYLGNGAALEKFVDERDARDLKNPEAVLEKLRTVRVCDPACGSGAYLVGMLHELVALRQCLFASRHVDPKSDYERKLEIIQNNLYGVDIGPIAVNIARLRLWLSLAVEFDGDNPPPLPNLDFKIECADSVLAPAIAREAELHDDQIRAFADLKAAYMKQVYNKSPLRRKIADVRRQLAAWIVHNQSRAEETDFDWRLDFAEVVSAGPNPGFDVILANPPYVQMGLIKEMKPQLETLYPDVYRGRADLYTYFFARGLELLRESGLLVFICSSTWTKTAAAAKLRRFLRDRTTVLRFLDFADPKVFKDVTNYPAIIIAQKSHPAPEHRVRAYQVRTIQAAQLEEELHAPAILVPQRELEHAGWQFEDAPVARLRQKIREAGKPLGEVVSGQIYRGVVTGLNEAFVIDQKTRDALVAADPKSAAILKPFLEGKDLKPWRAEWRGLCLIYTYYPEH
jgi:hypothetical protein